MVRLVSPELFATVKHPTRPYHHLINRTTNTSFIFFLREMVGDTISQSEREMIRELCRKVRMRLSGWVTKCVVPKRQKQCEIAQVVGNIYPLFFMIYSKKVQHFMLLRYIYEHDGELINIRTSDMLRDRPKRRVIVISCTTVLSLERWKRGGCLNRGSHEVEEWLGGFDTKPTASIFSHKKRKMRLRHRHKLCIGWAAPGAWELTNCVVKICRKIRVVYIKLVVQQIGIL